MSQMSDILRREFKKSDDIRDAGLTTPEDVKRFDDIRYGTDAECQLLDVYRPKYREGEVLPVIINVHGGGWVYGDKELYQYYCMSLAQRGFAVVNFTYRLAPEYKFPAALEDTNLVVQWMLAHAQEYALDTEHVFMVGDSAGAHLLGLYTGICTNPEYAGKYSFVVPQIPCTAENPRNSDGFQNISGESSRNSDELQNISRESSRNSDELQNISGAHDAEKGNCRRFRPTAIALNCGIYRVTIDENTDAQTKALTEDLFADGITEDNLDIINVLNWITEDYVPTCFMTCTGDFLKAQAALLYDRLMECQIPCVFQFYGDKDHELGHVFHVNMKLESAAKCNDAQCGFFRSFVDLK